MIPEKLKKELFTLPNQLTFFRIVSVPVIVALMLENTPVLDIAAALLFLLASITDLVDGWLAKKYNMQSKIGVLIDPLADKLLVISILIVLVHQDKIDMIIPVILIWREFGIVTLRGIATTHGILIKPSKLAKSKTFMQIGGLLGLIIRKKNPLFGLNWFAMGYVVIFISVFVSVISGYEYLRNYIKQAYKS